MATEVLPVSVVVPTVGRLEPLRRCLESLATCRPHADQILIVDQSHDPAVAGLVASFASIGARLVPCFGVGASKGRNLGLREAAHDIVLATDDDCTVAPDWVATAWKLMASDPEKILTGRVLPVGDPRAVPSTREQTMRCDFTGVARSDVLSANNMVLNRTLALAEGGFDERFGPNEAAEDADFCYRWLKVGRRLEFDPALVVWHHDWRTHAQLEQVYVRYMRGEGFLCAKHLRQGDLRILRHLGHVLLLALRGFASGLLNRRPRWTDPRRGLLRGLPGGLWHGWRVYWRGVTPDAAGAAAARAAKRVGR
jgi:GT2 family glycosyltransferase